jgi:hypothetical protein
MESSTVDTISMKDHVEEMKKLKEMYKPNNVFNVPVSSTLDFFKWWCIFLKPFVSLTPKEIDVVAAFLKQRYELSKIISDDAIIDEQLMGEKSRNKVLEECGISKQHFYVIMSNLRKNHVITESGINPRLIPNIREDDNGIFQLLVIFRDSK